MCDRDELDRQLAELRNQLFALPCVKGWQPVAHTRAGILQELREFTQRKEAVVERLEAIFRQEEAELVKLENQLCTLEEEAREASP